MDFHDFIGLIISVFIMTYMLSISITNLLRLFYQIGWTW